MHELRARAVLDIPDVTASNRLFLGMFKGDEHFRCLPGLRQGLNAVEKQRLIEAAVSLFLRGHRREA